MEMEIVAFWTNLSARNLPEACGTRVTRSPLKTLLLYLDNIIVIGPDLETDVNI